MLSSKFVYVLLFFMSWPVCVMHASNEMLG